MNFYKSKKRKKEVQNTATEVKALKKRPHKPTNTQKRHLVDYKANGNT